MTQEILLRAELRNPDQARTHLKAVVLPWIGQQLEQGRELVLEARLREDDITQRQRAYFHAVVLEEFHLYARPNGQQFPPEVWKTYLKEKFLGFKVVTSIDPMTGGKRRLRHRISTEDLGIRAYAHFIDQCIAFAATDCGFEVSQPLPPELRQGRRRPQPKHEHVDPETGEITEEAASA